MFRPSLSVPVVMCLLLQAGAAAQSSRPVAATGEHTRTAKNSRLEHSSAVPNKPVSSVAKQTVATSALRAAYGKLPLAFEPNRGQTDGQVKFLTRGRGFTFYLTPAESVLALRGSVPGAESAAQEHNDSVTQSVLRIQLAGANRSAKIEPQRLLPGITNYFIGSDPSRWRTHIPNYARVLYRQVYPGIDAVYYGNEGRLETDFMVAPGKDPGVIRMKFSGAERTEVNSAGELVLTTATGDVKLAKPVLYQQVKGERREVAGAYRLLSANEAGFVVGRYDSTRALVIDPTLVYSTYLGGSGMSGDTGNAIAVDAAGEAFVTGSTNSTDFPTQSARQAALGGTGATNAFVTKLSASGSALVFSTYLGGSNFDSGEGIALDSTNEPYIAGFTRSTDFPKTNRTPLNGSQDGFVTKLSADGSTLLFSFYLGGEVDDKASGIAVDGSGNAYVTGDTTSTLFPVTAGVFQPSLAGSDNAFVSKFDTNGATVWSTYLGGNNQDRGKSVAFDASSNVYVTGVTQSTSFPLKNPFQSALGGLFARNVFVTELNPTGTALVYSTYLGGSASDDAGGIVVDSGANFIVAGDANSSDFPIVNSLQAKSQFGDDLFVAKFAPSGSSVLFSTLFGDQSGSTEARGVALDSSNNIYVTGQTNATLMPTLNPLQGTPSPSPFDFESVFVVEFKSDGSDYLFSTFLDGSSNVLAPAGSSFSDVGLGIAVDPSANIYITGTSMTSDFPTVTAFQVALKSAQGDAFVAKIAPATLAGPQIFPPVLLLSTVAVAQTSPISVVTIENGTNTLTISSISISGPNAADFFQTNSCGSTLVAHVVCTIAVTVTPSVAGPLTATLDIFDSDPTTPHTAIPLSASGTPPPAQGVLNVTPSSLTFGNQEVSVSSAPQTVTLSNPGNVPVTVSLTNSGTNPFDFSGAFGTPCFSGGSIAAGASCTVGVTFTPTATGNRTANLQFSGNFTGSPILVAVSGVGVPTIATLTPTILTFGNQVVNTTSAAQSFTLTNTSSTQTLSNIVVALSTFSGTTFAISNNTCTTTLAPNASCTISITFTPTTAGQGGAFVTVTDSDPALQRGFLQGTGLNPQATLSPLFTSQIMFGRQNVGTTSVPSSLGLLNIGNTALVFTTPITGANAADYAVTNTCGGSMAPGLSCLLQVTFTPLAIGPRLATLTINSSTAGVSGVPVVLSVSGTGVNPTTASLAPASLTFPSQAVGSTSAPMVVTFSNNGARPLVTSNATITGANAGDFSFSMPSDPSTTGCGGIFGARYNPQVACPIVFTFTPSGTGPRTAVFTLTDSSSNSPHTVTLNGPGGTGPAVLLSSTLVQFPPQTVNTTSGQMSVTLTNTGNSDLVISTITVTGANAADFMTTNSTCVNNLTVPASGSCVFNFTFTPTTATAETARVTITDNAPGSPHTISLMGTGTTSTGTLLAATPYLSMNDSPFLNLLLNGNMYIEDMEFGSIVAPGITANCNVIGPGGATDSVDADDGIIDGSGTNGHSCFNGNGSGGVTVNFNATTLGGFPTSAGFVWTDGAGTTSFEAFDASGVSLGIVGPVAIADNSILGTTAEDHFFGVTNAGGISAMKLSNTGGGIEVDHVQYAGSGSMPGVNLSTASLTFAAQGVGTTSAAQQITVDNLGPPTLTTSLVKVSGDFAETDNCASVAIDTICTINVTFTPTTSGVRNGSVILTHNVPGGVRQIILSGMGSGAATPAVTLLPTSLVFGTQALNTTSSPAMTVMLSNTGAAALTINSITASGDFAQSNTCQSPLAAGANCMISVTFTPTATGSRTGAITILTNASTSPDVVSLTGTGGSSTAGFTFNPAPGSGTSVTLQPGSTGTFLVTFTPNPGFVGVVSFTCQAPIPNTICAISPATLNVTSSAPVTLTLTLRTNCTAFLLPLQTPRALPPGWGLLLALGWMLALGVWVWSLRRGQSTPVGSSTLSSSTGARGLRWLAPSLAFALLLLTWTGCGSSAGTPAIPGAPVTPPGNYTITLTGTAVGGGSQSIPFTIRVI